MPAGFDALRDAAAQTAEGNQAEAEQRGRSGYRHLGGWRQVREHADPSHFRSDPPARSPDCKEFRHQRHASYAKPTGNVR